MRLNCFALKIWGCAVVTSQCTTAVSPTRSCARAHVNWICDHLTCKAAGVSGDFPTQFLRSCVCVYARRKRLFPHGFIRPSDKEDPTGHAWTDLLCLYASHFLIKNDEQRGASHALSCPCWASCVPGWTQGEDPCGLWRRRPAMNPEEVIRRPVTSLVQSSKKAAHWHDVILHMSTFITATQRGVQKCKTCLVYRSLPLFDAPHIWYCKQCSAGIRTSSQS